MIRNIEVSKLVPHPQNPRQDLGDLTELVDSIKAQESCKPDGCAIHRRSNRRAYRGLV